MANIIAFFRERPKGCWHLPVGLFALRDSGVSVMPLETEGRHVESQPQGTPGKEMPAPLPHLTLESTAWHRLGTEGQLSIVSPGFLLPILLLTVWWDMGMKSSVTLHSSRFPDLHEDSHVQTLLVQAKLAAAHSLCFENLGFNGCSLTPIAHSQTVFEYVKFKLLRGKILHSEKQRMNEHALNIIGPWTCFCHLHKGFNHKWKQSNRKLGREYRKAV